MNYYLDTEFYENGPGVPIQLISIGIVAEDGRELYYENSDVDLTKVSDWLKKNVVPHLRGGSFAIPHKDIGSKVLNFLAADKKPVFWAYYGDYDWVLFAQLFGRMVDMPNILPHFAMDLKQELFRLNMGKPAIPNVGPLHDALADAHWNRALHVWIKDRQSSGQK